MKRALVVILILVAGYFASGLYIVGGNEKALLRRFGRARLPLVGSGLHYALPWPMTTISRINPSEVRTLQIGGVASESLEGDQFLLAADQYQLDEFLTGDKNILNVQVNVQYRISEADAADYLFGCVNPEEHLRLMTESLLGDVVARSGVDFVHPLGLAELRAMLTQRTRELVQSHRLGIVIEDVDIAGVSPPLLVKQAFVDVSNARASKQRFINEALAYREQTVAAASANARKNVDEAETARRSAIESARGEADRFGKIVAQFQADADGGVQTYEQSRQMTLRQKYLEMLETIVPKLASKALLDTDKPVNLTIFPENNK
ncbi:protease modulator HflK [Symmachiella dynata]|uniref:Modulator of FtsH protease HflK n=1 Tax=Symmachiella dynata TaxID=2527995 RepID=A0A517ZJR8_9PLAN|nr:protease modulator HflK [Symmachiella dynata]QDU42683.1 Modulator of FtsH protease HflK [Symmachiella dynata]